MQTRPTPQALTAMRDSYDPFGERVDAARSNPADVGDRRARNAALAVFWTAALLLTAGRVYYRDTLPLAASPAPQLANTPLAIASLAP